MLIGVAASSSFQHSRNATLRPGQSVSNDGYVFHYVRPTRVGDARADLVRRDRSMSPRTGKQVTTLHTMQSFYPSTNAVGRLIGRFFDSTNADSTIGLDAGPLRDIWTVASAEPRPAERR